MLCFDVGKHLGKCVGDHVVSRTINDIDGTIIDDESSKMILNIKVFCASMIRPIMGERNGIRLNTSPGYPRLITGRLMGKPAGMETRRSESLVITGLHGSECVFWVLRVPATGTCKTIVFLNFILCS